MHFAVYMWLAVVVEALLLWWLYPSNDSLGSADEKIGTAVCVLFLAAVFAVADAIAFCWHIIASSVRW